MSSNIDDINDNNGGIASMFLAFDVQIVSDNARTHQQVRSEPSVLSSQSDRSTTSCRWDSSCCESSPAPISPEYECNALHARIPSSRGCESETNTQDSHQRTIPKIHTNVPKLEASILRLPTIPLLSSKKHINNQDSFPPRLPPRSWLEPS